MKTSWNNVCKILFFMTGVCKILFFMTDVCKILFFMTNVDNIFIYNIMAKTRRKPNAFIKKVVAYYNAHKKEGIE